MEVVDGLATVVASVDDEAVAAVEMVGAGEIGGFGEEGAEEDGVVRDGVGEGSDVASGDEEEVGGGLGVDVGEGEEIGGFVDALRGDGSGDDFAEEAVGVGIRHEGYGTRADQGCGARCMMRACPIQPGMWGRRRRGRLGGDCVAAEYMNEPTFARWAARQRGIPRYFGFLKSKKPEVKVAGPGSVG